MGCGLELLLEVMEKISCGREISSVTEKVVGSIAAAAMRVVQAARISASFIVGSYGSFNCLSGKVFGESLDLIE
jgi:hypothetical protein